MHSKVIIVSTPATKATNYPCRKISSIESIQIQYIQDVSFS